MEYTRDFTSFLKSRRIRQGSKRIQTSSRLINERNPPLHRQTGERKKRATESSRRTRSPLQFKPDPPPKKEGGKAKRCPFHDLNGHTLEECQAFRSKSLDEKTEWLLAAGLCYRCLSKGHTASDCKENIECTICKDKRHPALLHRERTRPPTRSGEPVDSKCTMACNAMEGGTSCSKMLLVIVYSKERPHAVRRVYAHSG